jgi:hypothetical protein
VNHNKAAGSDRLSLLVVTQDSELSFSRAETMELGCKTSKQGRTRCGGRLDGTVVEVKKKRMDDGWIEMV